MATIFDTVYVKPLDFTQVRISRKTPFYGGAERAKENFEHEKIEATPVLSIKLDVPYDKIDIIDEYVSNFWEKKSPAKLKYTNTQLTNAQLYEYQLRKKLDEAIGELQEEWNNRLFNRTKKLLEKQLETAE